MFRTLLVMLTAISISGCQSYQATLQLPDDFQRIQVQPIRTNRPIASDLITNSLIIELGKHYTIVENDPDIVISGSAEMRKYYGVVGPSFISYAVLLIEGPQGAAGTIRSKEGWFGADDPQKFAKKVKNILTKPR